MLEVNDKNDAARMLDGDCKIHVRESEKLLEPEKWRNSQMCIEFNDLCYSVRGNHKGKHFVSIKVVILRYLDLFVYITLRDIFRQFQIRAQEITAQIDKKISSRFLKDVLLCLTISYILPKRCLLEI